MINIKNTGERILLEKETPLMIERHLCAYRFAKDYVWGKSVLDIGCGQGYGTDYLAAFAKEAIGLDYEKDAIAYANDKYKRQNLKYVSLDVKELITLDRKFQVICSFQVIEHIADTENFLKNIFRLLDEFGVFICSTPNRLDASPGSITPANRFHVREYLFNEFRELLGACFDKVEIYGLQRSRKLNFYRRLKKIGITRFLPESIDPVKRFYGRMNCNSFNITKERIENALDFIAVLRR